MNENCELKSSQPTSAVVAGAAAAANGGVAGYCIEGTVTFGDIRVLDAVGSELPIETFIADGVRHWDALYARDERLSVESQREAQQGAPKWRDWATGGQSAVGSF